MATVTGLSVINMSFAATTSMRDSAELSSTISSSIYAIASNVSQIQKNVDSYRTGRDSTELRQQNTTLIEETRNAIKNASKQLKEYMAIPTQANVRAFELTQSPP
jgi:hypothetical protein